MKRLCFGVALLISTPVFAVDFESAMAAYDRQEYRTAFKSFGELAAGGDADAQFMLGRLYAAGNGVVQDYVQAHKWYNLAASQGHKQAARARDTVAKEMTAQQIADAQRLAREWQSGGAAPGASAASPSPPAATEKPTRPMIASIQRGLKTLGYPITATDGKLGPKTKSIIRTYQTDHGLTVTSLPSATLLAHIEGQLGGGQAISRPPAGTQLPPIPTEPSSQPSQQSPWQWPRALVAETFQDGDYTRNPRWQVASGEFFVERGAGLRSTFEPPPTAESPPPPQNATELGLSILQEILEQTTSRGKPPAAPQPEYAEIFLERPITNAFAIQIDLASRLTAGGLEFGPYQNTNRGGGYRLVYTPGAAAALTLIRLTSAGSSVVETTDKPLKFEDGRRHTVLWTRDKNAEMAVAVDGHEIMRVTDRSTKSGFAGFTLINRGGDYGVRALTIEGSN